MRSEHRLDPWPLLLRREHPRAPLSTARDATSGASPAICKELHASPWPPPTLFYLSLWPHSQGRRKSRCWQGPCKPSKALEDQIQLWPSSFFLAQTLPSSASSGSKDPRLRSSSWTNTDDALAQVCHRRRWRSKQQRQANPSSPLYPATIPNSCKLRLVCSIVTVARTTGGEAAQGAAWTKAVATRAEVEYGTTW